MAQEERTSTGWANGRSSSALVENLVVNIVPVLVKSAGEALQLPRYEGLEFATLLLEDALKYGTLYPRAHVADELMFVTVKKFRQWNTFENHNR